MEKGFKKVACDILGITQRSYSNYATQDRAIIKILEKYFKKEELEEFLKNKKIKKMELIRGLSIEELEDKLSTLDHYDKDQRVKEIILLLNKNTTLELTNILNSCLEQFNLNHIANYDKFAIIEKLKNLLEDLLHENKDTSYESQFSSLIKCFNKKIHFDFSSNDIPVLLHILTRFDVYNNLYGLNEDN